APLETDDILPILPEDDPTQSPGTGSGDGGGDTKRDNNIVKNLTEGLTGSGDDSTTSEDQSLTEFLGGTLEDVVGGLLGGSGS
ncbi:MAG TPA: hypothetical protein VHH54_02480, partial [Actinomycetota bacterium]|nr:hypothetical protein [Actinomycetota bacterium]